MPDFSGDLRPPISDDTPTEPRQLAPKVPENGAPDEQPDLPAPLALSKPADESPRAELRPIEPVGTPTVDITDEEARLETLAVEPEPLAAELEALPDALHEEPVKVPASLVDPLAALDAIAPPIPATPIDDTTVAPQRIDDILAKLDDLDPLDELDSLPPGETVEISAEMTAALQQSAETTLLVTEEPEGIALIEAAVPLDAATSVLPIEPIADITIEPVETPIEPVPDLLPPIQASEDPPTQRTPGPARGRQAAFFAVGCLTAALFVACVGGSLAGLANAGLLPGTGTSTPTPTATRVVLPSSPPPTATVAATPRIVTATPIPPTASAVVVPGSPTNTPIVVPGSPTPTVFVVTATPQPAATVVR